MHYSEFTLFITTMNISAPNTSPIQLVYTPVTSTATETRSLNPEQTVISTVGYQDNSYTPNRPGQGQSYMASDSVELSAQMQELADTVYPYGPLPGRLQEFFTENFPTLRTFMNERENFSIYGGEVKFNGRIEDIEKINLYVSGIEMDGQFSNEQMRFLPNIEDMQIARDKNGEKVLIIKHKDTDLSKEATLGSLGNSSYYVLRPGEPPELKLERGDILKENGRIAFTTMLGGMLGIGERYTLI